MAARRRLVLTLFCACALVRQALSAKFVANPASRLSNEQRKFIDHLWKPDLALSDSLIRQGYKHEVEGRNWAHLADKLQLEGSNVTIVAFGGSVTVSRMLVATVPGQSPA